MKLAIGIILIVIGCYFLYDGYELKNTKTAVVEREVSNLMKIFPKNRVKLKNKINDEAKIKLIAGGSATLIGLVLFITGFTKNETNNSV